MRMLLYWLTCLLLAGAGLSAHAEPGISETEIVLGMSVPLSGVDAYTGAALKEGVATWLRFINDSGGINGRRLKLLVSDDAGAPARTIANTRRMITEDGVFALVSYHGIKNVESILPLLAEEGVPLVGAANGADSLRDPVHRYLFNIRASYLDEGDAIVTQLDAQGLNQIAVFFQNDSVGRSVLSGARAAMARLAIKPAVIAEVAPSMVNLKQVADMVAATKPQAVLMAASDKAAAELIRQMHTRGAYPQFIAVSSLSTDQLMAELNAKGRGVGASQVIPYPYRVTNPLTKQYLSLMKQYGGIPSYASLEGFIAAKLVVEALKRSGRHPTREKLIFALEDEFDLGGYHLRFAPGVRSGSRFVEMSVIGPGGKIVH